MASGYSAADDLLAESVLADKFAKWLEVQKRWIAEISPMRKEASLTAEEPLPNLYRDSFGSTWAADLFGVRPANPSLCKQPTGKDTGFSNALPCSADLTEEARQVENAKLYFEEYYLAAAMHKRMKGAHLVIWKRFKALVSRIANIARQCAEKAGNAEITKKLLEDAKIAGFFFDDDMERLVAKRQTFSAVYRAPVDVTSDEPADSQMTELEHALLCRIVLPTDENHTFERAFDISFQFKAGGLGWLGPTLHQYGGTDRQQVRRKQAHNDATNRNDEPFKETEHNNKKNDYEDDWSWVRRYEALWASDTPTHREIMTTFYRLPTNANWKILTNAVGRGEGKAEEHFHDLLNVAYVQNMQKRMRRFVEDMELDRHYLDHWMANRISWGWHGMQKRDISGAESGRFPRTTSKGFQDKIIMGDVPGLMVDEMGDGCMLTSPICGWRTPPSGYKSVWQKIDLNPSTEAMSERELKTFETTGNMVDKNWATFKFFQQGWNCHPQLFQGVIDPPRAIDATGMARRGGVSGSTEDIMAFFIATHVDTDPVEYVELANGVGAMCASFYPESGLHTFVETVIAYTTHLRVGLLEGSITEHAEALDINDEANTTQWPWSSWQVMQREWEQLKGNYPDYKELGQEAVIEIARVPTTKCNLKESHPRVDKLFTALAEALANGPEAVIQDYKQLIGQTSERRAKAGRTVN
eukprot:TRINITY_DN36456_c0_g1_i2.p1 TRINITY_DN36456_c0_g1~~TRINITY_DN36456_c0_g1_i2.p1  ORF type:complete len:697 (+),score=99.28 TRINITY_DN36456_c0_g1_i2:20-2110(+)